METPYEPGTRSQAGERQAESAEQLPATEPDGANRSHPVNGLSGWLILTQISLWLSLGGSALYLLNGLLPLFAGSRWDELTNAVSSSYDPMWAPVLIVEAAGNIVLIALIAAALIFMYRRKRSFKRTILLYYGAVLLLNATGYVMLHSIHNVPETEFAGSASKLARNVVSCLIWIPYFIRSKRVRGTFVK